MVEAAEFDAFISYSHRHDRVLGPVLQAHLERFAKPWYRMRALRIFRDSANLAASPALWASIEDALQSSRWFVLLASQDAAESVWVNREVQWWLDHRSAEQLLVIGTSPGLAWDEQAKDWAASAPVPAALRGVFTTEPHWVELSNISLHRGAVLIPDDRVAAVAASIRGLQKDALVGEHLRRHRHAMRLAWGTAAFLLALSVGLAAVAFVAVRAREQAISERDAAVAGQLVSKSEALGDSNPVLARLESVAAWRIKQSDETRYAMLNAAMLPGIAILTARSGQVDGVAFSRDGKILATGTSDGRVQLWDVATRKEIGSLMNGNGNEANAVAFSRNGRILATESSDGTVRLWNVAARRQIGRPLPSNAGQVACLAFSPDGRLLAVGDGHGQAQLWNVATRRRVGGPLPGEPGAAVASLAFSPDGKILAVGAGTVQLWDIATRQRIGSPLPGDAVGIYAVAFSPDNKTLAAGGTDGQVRLWDVATQQQAGVFRSSSWVYSAAFSPDGKTLAIGHADGQVQLWDVVTRQQIGSPLTGHTGAVNAVEFSPGGKTLATGSADGTARLWSIPVATGDPIGGPLQSSSAGAFSIAFSPDGKTLAAGTLTGTAQLWNVATRQPIGNTLTSDTAGGTDQIASVAFSPDNRILATGGSTEDGTARLWNVLTRQQIGSPLTSNVGVIDALAFSPRSRTLAIGIGRTAMFWDVTSHRRIGSLPVGNGQVTAVAFSADGRILATGSFDGTARLWDVSTHRPIGLPLADTDTNPVDQIQSSEVNSVAFSPDGTVLAVASGDGTARLWDVATHQQIGSPLASNGAVTSVAFSPDGRTLATGSDDGTARLWDVATHQQIGSPLASNGAVTSVAFSPDGRTLASGSVDDVGNGAVQFWDVAYLANPARYLCASAGRSLTQAEWAQYVSVPAYQNVCQ